MQVRILLLQARVSGDPIAGEELRSFTDRAGIDDGSIVPWHLLAGPPSLDRVIGYDALMIGGAGDYDVSKGNLPEFERMLELLREVVALAHPTFASCFGFQLLVQALGGDVVPAPDRTEVGTVEVSLTAEGRADELTGTLPAVFPAQVGRKELARTLPPDVVHLAASEKCPYHAMRVPGAPIWATQFHPEMTHEENRRRLVRYAAVYGPDMGGDALERALAGFVPSPQTERLIGDFLQLVFG